MLRFLFNSLAQSVKIMIAVAIFLTYALQFYVPFEIIWRNVKPHCKNNEKTMEYVLRIVLVVCTGNIFLGLKFFPIDCFVNYEIKNTPFDFSWHCSCHSQLGPLHLSGWSRVSLNLGTHVPRYHRSCHFLGTLSR